ncbi:hypothetical protein PDE_01683 [Penicillium oxalicum 114-2]|uniref:Uncharacterized protein n=1 Tax=Penicillium oxalicum (strain 114-2 / CGMCC 5302) TaxID=933388 RepID=S7Z958_PENO1|nr:hypothetical protein PDE_01683 [Penicillium oxalicum 114-2]
MRGCGGFRQPTVRILVLVYGVDTGNFPPLAASAVDAISKHSEATDLLTFSSEVQLMDVVAKVSFAAVQVQQIFLWHRLEANSARVGPKLANGPSGIDFEMMM